jgi:hypothetical protein
MGELVTAAIQFAIAERLPLVDEGDGLRCASRLF